MRELPSMDDILRDSARNERRTSLRLGLFLIAASLAFMFGLHAMVRSDSLELYAVPTGGLVYGFLLVTRAFTRRH
ncbi:MAG: hypothetical protein ABI678_26410 [Kofleriaceae bacterium]